MGAYRITKYSFPLYNGPFLKIDIVNVPLRRLPDRQIGLCFHECLSGVTPLIFYRRDSAATTITADDIDAEAIRSAASLHVSGVALQISEWAKEACLSATRVAAWSPAPTSSATLERLLLYYWMCTLTGGGEVGGGGMKT